MSRSRNRAETTPSKTRRDLNTEVTRREIVREARRLFARRGYAMTTLGEVVRAAKVTTGAVYHHFRDKKGLFLAVAESIEADILQEILTATRNLQDPWSQLVVGASAMLDICCEADVRRIILLDAPNVIGASEWRQIELRYGYGAMHRALTALHDAGIIRPLPTDVVAPMLLASMIEAANSVAAAKQKTVALTAAKETIALFLRALRQ